ncbi:MAG: SPOR domain-containing protein [Candidatus Neomarinimicrobiota bacterium]|jgi:hypothetical protein|nr:SPOR domain-containing protein [Candidatus Neomarinimicrobiota bacterium]
MARPKDHHKEILISMVSCLKTVLFIVILFFSNFIQSQNLTRYFELMEEGKLSEVRSDIDHLVEQFPNHAGVMFLAAQTQEQAEDAVMAYKKLIQNHPNSKYADDSMIKVGEYLYSRGLYTQASSQLAKVPKVYPTSVHVQRAIDLQINSLQAIGEKDSIDTYIAIYQKEFPSLDFNYNFESGKPLVIREPEKKIEEHEDEELKQAIVTQGSSQNLQRDNSVEDVSIEPRPYVLQVGAYGSEVNAKRQKQRLEQAGHVVELWPINVGGKQLQAVQIVRFKTREEARKIGKSLKKNLGFKYIVIKREE